MAIFIAARAVEGAAGGMDAVIALGTVAKVFPARQRARILALFSTMWALPAVVGPAAGAFIADTIGWRWAFYAFIPLVALSAVLVLLNLRDTPTSESQPMDAIKVLAQPGLSAAIAAFFFVFSAFFGADGFVPLYLTHERHQPLIIGGFSVMLAALGWTFAGMAVPRLRSNLSTAALVSIAGVFLIAGCSVLTFATVVPIHIAIVLAFWMLGGAGIGVAYTTIFADVFERAESGREGAVTSSALMAALLGMVFGTGFGGLALTVAQRLGYSIGAGLLGAFGFALLSAMGLLTIAHRQSPPGESGRIIFRES
jgi:predicted MFS family arabinose efflux permease